MIKLRQLTLYLKYECLSIFSKVVINLRNLLSIFILLALILVIFVGKAFYDASILQTTFGNVFPLQPKLTDQLIDNYFSTDEQLKREAEKSIKKIVLRDLDYNNWLDYIDYIEVNIYPIENGRRPQEELIIALNLSKDEGIIGVYKHEDLGYILTNRIEGLTFIKNVTRINDSINDRVFLVIEESLDESLGAFFIDNFIRIYTDISGEYKEVYRQSLDYQAYYYEKWTDPSIENPKWYKLTEKSIFDYLTTDEGKIIMNVSKNVAKFKSNSSQADAIPENFMIVTEKNFDITSVWNEDFKYFIQGIGRIRNTNEIVGIIESSDQTADSLLNSSDKYYKVIDKNGKINYIVESSLELLRLY